MASEMTIRVGDDVAVSCSPMRAPEHMANYLASSFFDGRGYARWTDLPSAPVMPMYSVEDVHAIMCGRML